MNRQGEICRRQKPFSSRQKNQHKLYTCICQNATCKYLRASGWEEKQKTNQWKMSSPHFFSQKEEEQEEFYVLQHSRGQNFQIQKKLKSVQMSSTTRTVCLDLHWQFTHKEISVFSGNSCTCKCEHKFSCEQTNH